MRSFRYWPSAWEWSIWELVWHKLEISQLWTLYQVIQEQTGKEIVDIIFSTPSKMFLQNKTWGGTEYSRIHKVLVKFQNKEGYHVTWFSDCMFEKLTQWYTNKIIFNLNLDVDAMISHISAISLNKKKHAWIYQNRFVWVWKFSLLWEFVWNKKLLHDMSIEKLNELYDYTMFHVNKREQLY